MVLLLGCTGPTLSTDSEAPDTEESGSGWVLEVEEDAERPDPFPQVEVFSEELIHAFAFDLSSTEYSQLRNNPREWAEATLLVGGVTWDVGIKVKGSSTAQGIDDKPSLKIDFGFVHAEQRFYGMRRLNVHNMTLDPILSSEVLNWGFFRAADLPAPRVGYARVSIRGQDRGLYSVVEDIEDDFLGLWFEDGHGNLYENAQNYCDVESVGCFDREENDEGNDDALRALINAASLSGSAWHSAMKQQMDWDRFTGFMAMERAIAHWDSYSFDLSNYRLYHDPTADQWTFIPWSGDLGFGYRPWSYPDCGKHGVDPAQYDMGLLASRCEADEQCRNDVLDKMLDWADLVEAMDGRQRVEEALDRVRAEAETDPEHRYEMDHFESHGACVARFLEERPAVLRQWVSDNR